MTKRLRLPALLALLMLLVASPAWAGNAMRASLQLTTVNVIFDPATVAARCPPGSPQALVQSAGSGELTSGAYAGAVDWSDEHCSLLRVVTKHEVAPVQDDSGLLTLVTPGGDVLHIAYESPGVFTGDLSLAGSWQHRGNGPYTTIHGTGIFAGAAGHGHMGFFDDSGDVTIDLNGDLSVGD